MSIIEEDPVSADTAPARPWWFAPAIAAVVLGGLLGLAVTTLAPTTQSPKPITEAPPAATPSATFATSPRSFVIALADLPSGFALIEERDDQYDVGGAGYVRGWLVAYQRHAAAGDIVVANDLTTWKNDDDAQKAELEYREYRWSPSPILVRELPVGRELDLYCHAAESDAGVPKWIQYVIVCRVANMTSWITLGGPAGTVELSTALELAKAQIAKLH